MKKKLPEHGWCFVCGTQNPHSLGLSWYLEDDGSISCAFTLTDAQQGPPKLAHGGATAAVLDEAMGMAVWAAGLKVAAVNLEINYLQPVPLGQGLRLSARITERGERKIFSSGEIQLADGSTAVGGRGIYVVAPHLFEHVGLQEL